MSCISILIWILVIWCVRVLIMWFIHLGEVERERAKLQEELDVFNGQSPDLVLSLLALPVQQYQSWHTPEELKRSERSERTTRGSWTRTRELWRRCCVLALLLQQYLFYWFKSTSFTSTQVPALLVQERSKRPTRGPGIRILTLLLQKYLLY